MTFGALNAAGCSRTPGMPDDNYQPPASEFPDDDYQPVPEFPGDDNNDGQTDLPQEPIDTPDPLPAPPNPVNPGEHMILKSVAKTTSYILPFGNVQGVYVNIDVTWQPVRGAHEYWLYKNVLPLKHEVTRNNAPPVW